MSTKTHYSVPELATKARVSTAYLRQLLIAGRLDGFKIGKTWVISVDEAEKWLANRRARWAKY